MTRFYYIVNIRKNNHYNGELSYDKLQTWTDSY